MILRLRFNLDNIERLFCLDLRPFERLFLVRHDYFPGTCPFAGVDWEGWREYGFLRRYPETVPLFLPQLGASLYLCDVQRLDESRDKVTYWLGQVMAIKLIEGRESGEVERRQLLTDYRELLKEFNRC